MNTEESLLAATVYGAIQSASNYSERSQQSSDYRIGMSDLGYCSEKVRRMLAGIPEPVTDKLKAWIGTALGDHAEKACMAIWPHALIQSEVTVELKGDRGVYNVGGHPDLILPEGTVIDFKSSGGLEVVRRTGPSLSQQYQRHGYAAGALAGGLFNDGVTADDVQVANVWIDRTGNDSELHVQMEPFDPGMLDSAAAWLDEVIYAYVNETEAQKEPPREVCAKTCGHFATCRALDTDVEGLLTDDKVLAAVEMYREGSAMSSKGEKLKKEAKAVLTNVEGSTGQFAVRWVHVNAAQVNYTRDGYEKLDIKPIK